MMKRVIAVNGAMRSIDALFAALIADDELNLAEAVMMAQGKFASIGNGCHRSIAQIVERSRTVDSVEGQPQWCTVEIQMSKQQQQQLDHQVVDATISAFAQLQRPLQDYQSDHNGNSVMAHPLIDWMIVSDPAAAIIQ